MAISKSKYSEKQKKEALLLAEQTSTYEAAIKLSIPTSTIRTWRKAVGSKSLPKKSASQEKIERLEAEVKRLKDLIRAIIKI